MLIVRHLGTPNSGFNGCHCMRDPVLYRSMVTMAKQLVWRSKLKVTHVTNQIFNCDAYLKVSPSTAMDFY